MVGIGEHGGMGDGLVMVEGEGVPCARASAGGKEGMEVFIIVSRFVLDLDY